MLGGIRITQKVRTSECRVHPTTQTHGLNREKEVLDEEVRFDVNTERVHESQRNGVRLVNKAAADPFGHARLPIKIPVIDEGWPIPVKLREKVHHAVDILLGHVND